MLSKALDIWPRSGELLSRLAPDPINRKSSDPIHRGLSSLRDGSTNPKQIRYVSMSSPFDDFVKSLENSRVPWTGEAEAGKLPEGSRETNTIHLAEIRTSERFTDRCANRK